MPENWTTNTHLWDPDGELCWLGHGDAGEVLELHRDVPALAVVRLAHAAAVPVPHAAEERRARHLRIFPCRPSHIFPNVCGGSPGRC